MEVRNKKIAFFDSGVGGLTVFKKMKALLPNEDYIYFGDLKNLPYGAKKRDELISISRKVFDFFAKKNVKAVVMACNTTSAIAYEPLKDDYSFKIYPVIQSCAESISKLDAKNFCVLATNATVNSHAYLENIKKYKPTANVFEIPCPEWVPIVEEKRVFEPDSVEIIKKHLFEALKHAPEKIILGCTHYPFLLPVLTKFAPAEMFINPSDAFTEYIKGDLTYNNLLSGSKMGSEEFFVSDYPDRFKIAASMFYEIKNLPQKISLG